MPLVFWGFGFGFFFFVPLVFFSMALLLLLVNRLKSEVMRTHSLNYASLLP